MLTFNPMPKFLFIIVFVSFLTFLLLLRMAVQTLWLCSDTSIMMSLTNSLIWWAPFLHPPLVVDELVDSFNYRLKLQAALTGPWSLMPVRKGLSHPRQHRVLVCYEVGQNCKMDVTQGLLAVTIGGHNVWDSMNSMNTTEYWHVDVFR